MTAEATGAGRQPERRAEGAAKAGQQAERRTAPGQITVRPMTEADLSAVAALEAATFSMPWSADGFAAALLRPDTVFLVACGEELLGYAGVYCTADEGEITNVAVAEDARRRGIGRMLLEALRARLGAQRIDRIVLEVRVSNTAAIRLYETCGFTIAGRRRGFYERPVEDAYVMVCEPSVPYGKESVSSLQ